MSKFKVGDKVRIVDLDNSFGHSGVTEEMENYLENKDILVVTAIDSQFIDCMRSNAEPIYSYHPDDLELVPETEIEKNQIFFDKVKGKKIRWWTFYSQRYFIPEKLVGFSLLKGYDSEHGFNTDYFVGKGLGERGWSFVDPEEEQGLTTSELPVNPNHCSCKSPKRLANSAAGEIFYVCSKSQNGCGKEIV